MRVITSLRQRYADWLRERRISSLTDDAALAYRRGLRQHARALWLAAGDEINARSPEQVARMERKRGLR